MVSDPSHLRSHSRKSHQAGFSLIEVAIGLLVLSILLLPLIRMYSMEVAAEKTARNQTSAESAAIALTKYALLHGHYPFPARPSDILGSANFGHSAVKPGSGWPDCQSGGTLDGDVCSTVLNTVSGASVLIGVLPFAELNVPFTSVLDANKNMLTYAVTEDLTANATYSELAGAIIVLDRNGVPLYSTGARSHFVVAGHGNDGRGAFGLNGIRNSTCNIASSQDFENCNKDGTFRSNLIPGTVDIQINDTSGNQHFDDYVKERNSSASGIWSYLPDPGTTDLSINDRMGGNVATGNCDGKVPCIPVSRLDIYGENGSTTIPAVRADALKTKRICARGVTTGDGFGAGYSCVDDYSLAINTASTDNEITTCIWDPTPFPGVWVCPPGATSWNSTNLPPWFTPQIITGTPPVLPESGVYWMTTMGDYHTSFHRGNGVLCVGDRALNGVFDYDETCNDTSRVNATTRTTFSSCSTGTYARGIQASGAVFCQTPADNI